MKEVIKLKFPEQNENQNDYWNIYPLLSLKNLATQSQKHLSETNKPYAVVSSLGE